MNNFKTVRIPALRHAVALDGLDVRVLAGVAWPTLNWPLARHLMR